MGLRKTIYIPSEEIWSGIQEAAKKEGRSVSNYLVQLHLNSFIMKSGGEGVIGITGNSVKKDGLVQLIPIEKHKGHPDSVPVEVSKEKITAVSDFKSYTKEFQTRVKKK